MGARRSISLGAFAPLVAACALLVGAAGAAANGDPASHVLPAGDVFLPYPPNRPSKPLQQALETTTDRARRAGYQIKVALIADRADLGTVPQLLTDPQGYADLLTKEISFNTTPRVLVVSPSGFGGNNLGDNAAGALAGLDVDPQAGSDGLARSAMQAIAKLAQADGHPVALPAVAAGGGSGGGGTPAWVIFGLPVVLVAVLAGLASLRGRSRPPVSGE